MTRMWAIIQAEMDDPRHQYGPVKVPQVAHRTGVSDKVLYKWRAGPVLPEPEHLEKVSSGLGLDYDELLLAALQDRGYTPRKFSADDNLPTKRVTHTRRSRRLEASPE